MLQLATDAQIRPALRAELRIAHGSESEAVLIEELGMQRGSVRADLALIDSIMHGYEIKSDRDSLRRLDTQVSTYSKCFDRATLVTTARHINNASTLVPDWWGLIRVDMARYGTHFTTVRWPSDNPCRDARALVELLWLDDALELLRVHGLDRGVRGKPRHLVWDRLCAALDLEVIAAAVRANLKVRAKLLALQ